MASRKKYRVWTNVENGEEQEELLVFGYSCKLFRDDEKASYIEDGKHLIPWMGDDGIMIDRYDGRGYLHDLKQFEAGENYELPEDERLMEQMCDEERYLALSKDMTDEELYHEEELKRLRAALADDGTYNQVQFAYTDDVVPKDAVEGDSANSLESSDSIDLGKGKFEPPPELNVPDGLELPSTAKMNTIIEKTAMFVCRHSAQMEIVIKTKQANNPQFAFLSFDNTLNPYYKHMVQAIKSGKYVPKTEVVESSEDDDSDDEHYLHPSLLSGAQIKSPEVFSVPKIAYQRTGDDRYSLLVNQLKDKVYADMAEIQRSSPRPVENVQSGPVINADPSIPPPPGLEPVRLPPLESNSQAVVPVEELGPLITPPAELVPIVEKLAVYVAKNGEDFEAVVKAKGQDPRFQFLNSNHIYYPYYRHRLRIMQKDYAPKFKNNEDGHNSGDKDGSKCGVVSFSIKTKDSSDKKGFSGPAENQQDGNIDKSIKVDGAASCAENVEESADAIRIRAELQEARLAEERIRDRLAAAARERLAKVSKEKLLQQERKKKAAAFLSMIRKNKGENLSLIGPRLPTAAELETISNGDGDKASVVPKVTSTLSDSASSSTANVVEVSSHPVSSSDTFAVTDVTDTSRCNEETSSVSNSKEPVKKSSSYSHKKSRHQERSRSRSRSRSRNRRHRSRSSSSERRYRKRNRSRDRKRRRHRSSSSPEYKSKKDKRKSSRTPPASYMRVRNSSSPRRDSRSRSKSRNRHSRHSRSRSRH